MNIYDMMLKLTPKVGGYVAAQLIENFVTAEAIFSLSAEQIMAKVPLNEAVAYAISDRLTEREAHYELDFARKNNITLLSALDLEYPRILLDVHNHPHVIYAMGDSSLFNRNLISIVGTRDMTSYGERITHKIVEKLAEQIEDLVIVSGLAYGVDGAAHRAAIDVGVPTIAVLPCALPSVTPSHHRSLANAILDKGGALISEQKSSFRTAGKVMIARNRIVAGMSQATLVVESKFNGGSISTAEFSSNLGRVTGAIPGRITDEASLGCNRLIAAQVAIPIHSAEDLITALKWERYRKPKRLYSASSQGVEGGANINLTEPKCKILSSFQTNDPIHISTIELRSGIPISELSALLLEMELDGVIAPAAGSMYERIVELPEFEELQNNSEYAIH